MSAARHKVVVMVLVQYLDLDLAGANTQQADDLHKAIQ